MWQPTYFIRDIAAAKQMFVKDFDYFQDHTNFIDESMDELFGNSLILMKGQKWRDMRATLSPAFTGSKMRQMFELVADCAIGMANHFRNRADRGESINCEMKEVFGRCTTDIIASCAFGIKVDSLEHPDNEFNVVGKQFMKVMELSNLIKIMLIKKLPTISKFLGIEFVDKNVAKFFRSMVLNTMEVRERESIHRPDMIDMLMHVRKGHIHSTEDDNEKIRNKVVASDNEGFATVEESHIKNVNVKRQWTDTEVIAQCFLFFLGGFDSSSTLLTFVAYALAINPSVQQKLFEEILKSNDKLNGKPLSYDLLQNMKYLDQVICETLRIWPSVTMLDRVCVKDYDYDDGELKFRIPKGRTVNLSPYGIHHDPEFFPEPELFNPERFSDENRGKIKPGTYIPFGVGPRNCIGMNDCRWCLLEFRTFRFYFICRLPLCTNASQVYYLLLGFGLHICGE